MRAALVYFAAQHRASGYHETRINAAVERYGSMAPVWAHYSHDHLFGGTGREEWVAPDLAPLPFGEPTGNGSTTEGAT